MFRDLALSFKTEYQDFINRKYFGSLNGIRAISAIVVIQIHSLLEWPSSFPKIFNQGYLGVDTFFAISGFLIVTLLMRERAKFTSIDLKAFYVRRTLRIFPIYYAVIFLGFLLYFAISPWKPNGLAFYKDTFPVLLSYTQNIFIVNLGMYFHCWSLAMEEQFYLVWPAIEKYFNIYLRWAALLSVLFVSQLFNFGYFKDWLIDIYGNEEAYLMPMYLITFTPIILGVALAYTLNNRTGYAVFRFLFGSRASAIVLFLILLTIREIDSGQGLARLLAHITIVLMIGSLVVREDHFCSALLKNKVLFYLGSISYGLYLYHVFVMFILAGVFSKLGYTLSPIMTFIITLSLTFIAAHYSYQYFERPIMKLKKNFSR